MSLNPIENPTKIQKFTLKMPDKSTNSIENQPKIQQFHWKSQKNPTIPLKFPEKNPQQNLKLINQVGVRPSPPVRLRWRTAPWVYPPPAHWAQPARWAHAPCKSWRHLWGWLSPTIYFPDINGYGICIWDRICIGCVLMSVLCYTNFMDRNVLKLSMIHNTRSYKIINI